MEGYKMSFFKAPVWNKHPLKVVSLFWVWLTVTMKWMQLGVDPDRDISLSSKTERLRSLVGDEVQRQFKSKNFDYITPSGTFTVRGKNYLVSLANALIGGVIFGPYWNSRLTKRRLGVSYLVFFVLLTMEFHRIDVVLFSLDNWVNCKSHFLSL